MGHYKRYKIFSRSKHHGAELKTHALEPELKNIEGWDKKTDKRQD